jgi:hypothetical protein
MLFAFHVEGASQPSYVWYRSPPQKQEGSTKQSLRKMNVVAAIRYLKLTLTAFEG